MARFLSFWRNLLSRVRVDADLDDELRATCEALAAEKTGSGLSPAEARRAALLELGGIESVKQQVREARAGSLADSFLQDLRYAAALLIRNPLFTLTAALSLAIGIGATTAVFSVANGLLLRAAAGVADPGRLVDVVRRDPAAGPGIEQVSFPVVVDLRRQLTTVSDVFAYQLNMASVGLRFDDRSVSAVANLVTPNYFHALGVRPAAGRLFDAADSEQAGASPILVLSHRYWIRQFRGDPGIVGRTVRLNNVPLTVVGVAPATFRGVSAVAPDVWLPVSMVAAISPEGKGIELTSRRIDWLSVGARLVPGVSHAQASAQIATIGAALQRSEPEGFMPPPGAKDVDVASIDVTTAGYTPASGRELFRRVVDEVRRIPGVERATLADHAPGPGVYSFGTVSVPGATPRDGRAFVTSWTLVAPDYFATVGVPLLLGRDFGVGDREGSEPVAIVAKATADRLWPGRSPIGETLTTRAGMSPGATQGMSLKGIGGGAPPASSLRVVGVVADAKQGVADSQIEVELYVPIEQKYLPRVTIIARRDPDGSSLAPAGGTRIGDRPGARAGCGPRPGRTPVRNPDGRPVGARRRDAVVYLGGAGRVLCASASRGQDSRDGSPEVRVRESQSTLSPLPESYTP